MKGIFAIEINLRGTRFGVTVLSGSYSANAEGHPHD